MRIRIIRHISLILLVSVVAAVNVSGQEASPDITIDYPGQKPLWINCDAVNIRSKPDMKSEKMGLLARDAKVYLIDQSGSWSQVSFGEGKQGWVFTELLTAEAPVNMALNAEDYVDDSLGMAPRGLVLGPITESSMQVRINRTVVPAYTVQGTTCVFVGDLEKCGFEVTRGKNYCVGVGLAKISEPANAPAKVKPDAEEVNGDVTYPRWRLFISNRQIPAYEYKGRVLMQILDLSVLGALDIDLDHKRISFTSGEAWEDSYGLVFNFWEPVEAELSGAFLSGDLSWEYAYFDDCFGDPTLVMGPTPPSLEGERPAWLVAQLLAQKQVVAPWDDPSTSSASRDSGSLQIVLPEGNDSYRALVWESNPRLENSRQYISSPRVSSYLRSVMDAQIAVVMAGIRSAAAADEAARKELLRKNGNRPLKITYYYLEPDIIGIPVAYTKVLNLTEKTVDALEIELLCYDTFGRPVKGLANGNRQTMLYQGLLPSLYEITTYITLYGRDTTTKIHPILKRVHFTDGTVWKAD